MDCSAIFHFACWSYKGANRRETGSGARFRAHSQSWETVGPGPSGTFLSASTASGWDLFRPASNGGIKEPNPGINFSQLSMQHNSDDRGLCRAVDAKGLSNAGKSDRSDSWTGA
ncbi:acyloxyacyl hydrolase [Paraburkholderia sp.]|uniref:acyloxyacyl hydrolase n=1 Tax=Paraburkholderia sp. TaxID=1926495 RepID=UPI003C711425